MLLYIQAIHKHLHDLSGIDLNVPLGDRLNHHESSEQTLKVTRRLKQTGASEKNVRGEEGIGCSRISYFF